MIFRKRGEGVTPMGKNTLYGIDMTEVSECELIYQKY